MGEAWHSPLSFLPSLSLARLVVLSLQPCPWVSLLPDSPRDWPRSFLRMFSPLQKKVRATVRRQGLAALVHFLFGPPRLQPQLQGERELALAMAQCECPLCPHASHWAGGITSYCMRFMGSDWVGLGGVVGSARLSQGS